MNAAARKREERGEQVREISVRVLDTRHQKRNGHSRWEHEHAPSRNDRRTNSPVVVQWERENRSAIEKVLDQAWQQARRSWRTLALLAFAFTLGMAIASGPQSAATNLRLRERLRVASNLLTAREGELELTKLELARLNIVIENSRRYRIPADLSAKIYDIALAEGIDPKVAYSLVDVESDFSHKAISPVGALGLTQLMPNTAKFFEPNISRADLFDPDTNLRIGFRFLKELIAKYNGDVDLALHAYNRGPGVVDRVVSKGGNPANGYADMVMRGASQ
ncbi:MAG: lytic transglycosylase domain-containing protein [Gemmatimonadota bacterium]